MRRHRSHRSAGFTLLELVIVVGIAGLLFSGLWRLMSSGNSQLREQSAADQINQLANATRSFMASQAGQALLRAPDASVGPATIALTLPVAATPAGNAGCAAGLGDAAKAGIGAYCDFLPVGFSAVSVNSYNQTYTVVARKLDGAATVSPQNFDFMIATSGGDIIADNSGGRISANIGANGGFIYGAATCGAVTNACGAFGGFTFDPAAVAAAGGFGAVNPGAGHIVTLNSKGGENRSSSDWLARLQISGDALFGFNTMQEDLRMGANQRVPTRITNIEMTAPGGGVTSGKINMRTGVINLNDNTTVGNLTARAINLENGTIMGPGYVNIDFSGLPAVTTPLIVDTTTATAPTIAAEIDGQNCDNTQAGVCAQTLNVGGSVNVSRGLTASSGTFSNILAAGSFIYQSDMRLKKNIMPLTGALDKISRLQGYTFRWRNDDRADVGLVAQDVQKIYPELVRATGSDGKLGVEYGNLIAPMIEAIKELKTQNTELRTQLDAQQRTIDAMQHKSAPHKKAN